MQAIAYAATHPKNDQKHWIYIEPERHTLVVGETGTGKTTLFHNCAVERIRAGDGIVALDPHGPFAEGLLSCIPRPRVKDVVYIEPLEHPVDLNPLDHENHDLAKALIRQLFKQTWPDGYGPETENILMFTLSALYDVYPYPTLALAQRFVRSTKFRKSVVERVRDIETRSYFEEVYDGDWNDRMRTEKSAPVFNKLSKFLNDSVLRRMFSGKKSFDFRKAVDERQIVIVNLAQGRIGKENTAFIGGVIAFKHQQALLSRQDALSRGEDFAPSFAYIDEFQVMVPDVSVYLAEARKYKASLMLGTQVYSLLPRETQLVAAANCGNQITYRVCAEDARVLAAEFGGRPDSTTLVNLVDFRLYANRIVQHVPQRGIEAIAFEKVGSCPTDAITGAVLNSVRNNF